MFRIMMVLKIITEGQVLVSKATVSPHGTFIFVVDVINVIRIVGPRSKIQLDFSPTPTLTKCSFFFFFLFFIVCPEFHIFLHSSLFLPSPLPPHTPFYTFWRVLSPFFIKAQLLCHLYSRESRISSWVLEHLATFSDITH